MERTRTHNLAVGSVCKLRAETLPTQPPRHPNRANVISFCVRLHTRKLTRRPRTVGLPDNDKGASPADLREQIAYM